MKHPRVLTHKQTAKVLDWLREVDPNLHVGFQFRQEFEKIEELMSFKENPATHLTKKDIYVAAEYVSKPRLQGTVDFESTDSGKQLIARGIHRAESYWTPIVGHEQVDLVVIGRAADGFTYRLRNPETIKRVYREIPRRELETVSDLSTRLSKEFDDLF